MVCEQERPEDSPRTGEVLILVLMEDGLRELVEPIREEIDGLS